MFDQASAEGGCGVRQKLRTEIGSWEKKGGNVKMAGGGVGGSFTPSFVMFIEFVMHI